MAHSPVCIRQPVFQVVVGLSQNFICELIVIVSLRVRKVRATQSLDLVFNDNESLIEDGITGVQYQVRILHLCVM